MMVSGLHAGAEGGGGETSKTLSAQRSDPKPESGCHISNRNTVRLDFRVSVFLVNYFSDCRHAGFLPENLFRLECERNE